MHDKTNLRTIYGSFVTAIISLIAVGGTIIGILFILPYIKPLISKKGGLGMSA